MANLPWLDEVLGRLAKRGLPPNYVQRFAEELSDHLEDFTEENMSTEVDVCARLGEPEQVADAAITAYRQRSFLGRHPTAVFLVFAISPAVSLGLLFILALWGGSLILRACDLIGFDLEHRLGVLRQLAPDAVAALMSVSTVVIPAILASTFYGWLAKRLGIGRKWIILSCVILGLVSALPRWYNGNGDPDLPARSSLMFCLPIPLGVDTLLYLPAWILCNFQQLFQFVTPLAVGWWFTWRAHNQSRLQLVS